MTTTNTRPKIHLSNPTIWMSALALVALFAWSLPTLCGESSADLFASVAQAAETEGEAGHDHEAEAGHAEHDHAEFEYLYGNHFCPACDYADLVDPHYFADISNKKAGVYARVYLCGPDCAAEIKKDMAKYYLEVYRTDRETGEKKPPLDLKNGLCPQSGEKVSEKDSIEYNGMIVHFCCQDCIQAFLKEPEPGMRKLLPKEKRYRFPGDSADHDHDHEDANDKG